MDDHVASNEHLLPHTRGIVWLRTCAKEGSVPDRVFFDEEKKSKCYDNASSMLKYIVGKCAPLHPSIFSDVVLENWNGWFREQTLMWTRTNLKEYLLLLPPFIWPSSKQAQHCSNPLPTIEPSERSDPAPGMQIIVHDSGIHGEFSKRQLVEMKRKQCIDKEAISVQDVVAEKGCIFRWVDEDDCAKEYLWVGIVHAIEGSPSAPDCILVVRWCPRDRKRTYRLQISSDHTFDTKYCKMRGPTAKYVTRVKKENCLAFNLEFTNAGKFDSKKRLDGYLGSTLKEVATDVLEEYFGLHPFPAL